MIMKKKYRKIQIYLTKDIIYSIILKRIALCKAHNKEIIRFPVLNHKLATSLQINKRQIWDLITFLQVLGFLEIVTNHGIILNYKIIDDKIKLLKNKPKV